MIYEYSYFIAPLGRSAMIHIQNSTPRLRKALSEIEAAGFAARGEVARSRCFAAYTSSSEWLGEVGESITEVLATCGPSILVVTREKLYACIEEVAKVWPAFCLR
jgi:hypothetical protein